jgi:hypothetical protein
MTKHQAQEQAQKFRQFGKDLTQSLQRVMTGGATGAQFTDYRDIVGQLLGYSFFVVLNPIWSRYPDIEPEEMRKRNGVPPSPPLPVELCRSILELVAQIEDGLLVYQKEIEVAGEPYYLEASAAHQQNFADAFSAAREFVRASHPELLEDSIDSETDKTVQPSGDSSVS